MRGGANTATRATLLATMLLLLMAGSLGAQTNLHERVFPQRTVVVEKALKAMQSSLSGRLPVLDGFATPGQQPLDRYQRGFYQATAQVLPTASGGSLVRVSAKITAWFHDPVTSASGYQALASNGRIEEDLLDQLAEQLAASQSSSADDAGSRAQLPRPPPADQAPVQTSPPPSASAPLPDSPSAQNPFSSPLGQSYSATEPDVGVLPAKQPDKATASLRAEAAELEQILKNVAHPHNLVAVKKSGTPVVGSAALTAKPLFLATQHDEFELLDFNRDWVHVKISGLSRGWIWRNSVEMPDGIADTEAQSPPAPTAVDLFHVVREENGQFPGDWPPLRGKTVKILSVQKVDENAKGTDPKDRLEYAKFLFDKNSPELANKAGQLAGLVLIFDSADGGMIAVTASVVQQWKTGALTDAALWHQSFFDPPETFDSAAPQGSQ